ncbi:MAG: SpoIIE family protein phosphatase [Candidatus Gallimonas sp.]
MKKNRLRAPLPRASYLSVCGYVLLPVAMFLLNYALPQKEPVSFALLFAALSCGLSPFLCGAAHVVASVASLSLAASLSAAVQSSFLALVFCVYLRLRRRPGAERAVFALIAQLPFVFLFPHAGYAYFPFPVLLQKTVLSLPLFLLSLLFDGGLHALLFRAFRCRLSAGALAELCLAWLFLGLGLFRAFGESAFYAVSLFLLLASVLLLNNASAVPFAIALSLPLCLALRSPTPCAVYAVFACLSLLLAPYGKTACALTLFLAFLAEQSLTGLYSESAAAIAVRLLSCALPAILLVCLPEKLVRRARKTLVFYRERTLPRVAVNRNRRAVGERLYEVSALFREIETAFSVEPKGDDGADRLRESLKRTVCLDCPNARTCAKRGADASIDRLIAVGKTKGRVNLIDLPGEITAICTNVSGLLYTLNRSLAEYASYARELESARTGRKLLAGQARGISEILRDLALEQSEEYAFPENESALAGALAEDGILGSEFFVYGEGNNLTVTMTVPADVTGKRLCEAAGRALGIPLSLSEKIPLTSDRVCCVLRRRATFDAAFGIAARSKDGENSSGDTHSILRIDERRFLVALSDGMGSGEEARTVSDHTLSLLESFYKAKMPSEIVLDTVNRLIAYSSEESFACLDLAAVDLDTGSADVVKIGSPAGFLISGEELRVLEGKSFPMGALEAVHPATMQVSLQEDDFLLFMSDGVSDAFDSSAELYAYLSALRPLNPQSFAEEVLREALARRQGRALDDMTVVAVRLMKAA